MNKGICCCAILLIFVLQNTTAWTNPTVSRSRLAPLSVHTAPAPVQGVLQDEEIVSLLLSDKHTIPDLLQQDEWQEEMTKILLDTEKHPPGTLSWDVLDASFPLLYSWSKTQSDLGARVAEALLERLELEHDFEPSRKHYAVVMNAWLVSGDVEAAAQHTHSLLNKIRHPNRVVYNSVLTAHARNGNIERAMEIFDLIENPELQDYNAMLSAFAKVGNARAAEGLLKEMMTVVVPDTISYNCVLDAWSKSGQEGAADRALEILHSLPNPNAKSYSSVASALLKEGRVECVEELLEKVPRHEIDAYLRNALLEGWAVKGQATRAQAVLEQMQEEGIANSVSYNTVIKAWTKSRAKDAPIRARALLERMQALQLDDVFSYTSVIDCYAKSKQPDSAQQAESLLEQMMDRPEVQPNTVTINCVLDALAKSGQAARAEQLLERMEDPNTISYTSVIDAYAKSNEPNAAQKAEEVFQKMEAAYQDGNVDAKPNNRSFNAVINAWAQNGEPGSAERAEAILDRMEESYQAGDQDLKPNVVSYSIVMNGWSKSNSLERTSQVFSRMVKMYKSGNEDARPNFVSFVTLIDAIVKSGEPGAAQRAEDVLRQMGNLDAKPNFRLATSVMDCWARSGARNAGEKVEALLDWMIETCADEDGPAYKPNEITFNTVINAWAKSRVFGKAYRAKTVLQKMVDMYEADSRNAKPNTYVYTGVLNACAYAIGDEKMDALQIATTTFSELCNNPQYGKPNHVTYAAYLTACRNLLEPGDARLQAITSVFGKCCADGQVNASILRRLESALTPEELKELYQSVGLDGSVDVSRLPAEWTRNVVENKRRRR